MATKPTAFRFRPLTCKMLRVWCAAADVPEGETLDVCLRMGCRELAADAGDAVLAAYHAAIRVVADGGAEAPASPEPTPPARDLPDLPGERRRVVYGVSPDALACVRVLAALLGESQNAVAERAVQNWITHLTAMQGDEFADAFFVVVTEAPQ